MSAATRPVTRGAANEVPVQRATGAVKVAGPETKPASWIPRGPGPGRPGGSRRSLLVHRVRRRLSPRPDRLSRDGAAPAGTAPADRPRRRSPKGNRRRGNRSGADGLVGGELGPGVGVEDVHLRRVVPEV